MTTVVVLGGAGFLGAHVVRALEGDPRVHHVLAPGRRTFDLDRLDPDGLTALLRDLRPAAVVNCTGRLDGGTAALVAANTMGTAKLLDAVATAGCRLVRIGSAGEYGPLPPGEAAREDGPAEPVGVYGASHLAATRLVELARRHGVADAVTLRVFNPIGPGLREQTVLGRAAAGIRDAVRTGAQTVVLGPLSAYRDFVDARDVGAAVVAACLASSPGPTVNVGSGQATRVRDAVRALADLACYHGAIVEQGHGAARSAGVDWMLADIRRAHDELGWQPGVPLEESLAAIWSGAGAPAVA